MKLVTLMSLSLLLVNCAAFNSLGQRADGLKAWPSCDPMDRYGFIRSTCGGKQFALRKGPIVIVR